METLWFILVLFLLTGYVVLDGFDLGSGAVHLFAARPGLERRTVIAAIGPVWDGNEVWLLAAGGTLFFAFPKLFSSSLSGFYLPLTLVLWLLILRALGIEFRGHIRNDLWRSFFDAVFACSSMLLTVLFGAALGNILRGVPLGSDGYFFAPLWTDFAAGPRPGVLDWYTLLLGIAAFVILTGHGALYIALKSDGELRERSRLLAARAWWGSLLLTIAGLAATLHVRPGVLDNYAARPVGTAIPLAVLLSLGLMAYFRRRGRDGAAFLASSFFIAAMLGGAAFAIYPAVLPSSTDPAYNLTIHNTAAAGHGLRVAVAWWSIGMALTIGYLAHVYRTFRGKVRLEE